jgi:amino acid transporter
VYKGLRISAKLSTIGIIFAALITFFLFMLRSIAIAIVIPKNQISLAGSVMDAFKIFLENYHISWLTPIMGFLLMFGALAETNSWIIGAIKGLYATAAHGNLPPILQKQNKNNIPLNLLILQSIIVTIASICFLFMQSISIYTKRFKSWQMAQPVLEI